VSPVFRHGGLRLYLLKLLDEAPRHGYEVIRLLQDRFLGVYSPSPGTIYPRLARLEEEGLVTHDEVDGRKVYRITDKGREEINSRLDDLAELEEELTESVRDIAREVTEDVRDTVRNLREELTWAAKDVRRESREHAREETRERARRARDEVRESARRARDEARQGWQQAQGGSHGTRDTAREARDRLHEEARRARQVREEARRAHDEQRGDQRREEARSTRREWADWASSPNWQGWAGGWRSRPGGGRGWPGSPGFDAGLLRDLERLAVDFARDLRKAAWNTESIGENALGDLRSILEDALTRIKDEVFGAPAEDTAAEDTAAEDTADRETEDRDTKADHPRSEDPPGEDQERSDNDNP
jgi:DNA-binding PadR family transcriptional regulator